MLGGGNGDRHMSAIERVVGEAAVLAPEEERHRPARGAPEHLAGDRTR